MLVPTRAFLSALKRPFPIEVARHRSVTRDTERPIARRIAQPPAFADGDDVVGFGRLDDVAAGAEPQVARPQYCQIALECQSPFGVRCLMAVRIPGQPVQAFHQSGDADGVDLADLTHPAIALIGDAARRPGLPLFVGGQALVAAPVAAAAGNLLAAPSAFPLLPVQ